MQDSSSANAFLGYHGAFQGSGKDGRAVDFHYAVIAYPGPPNPNSNSQGFAADFDQLTSVASHEMAEALTDPDANYKTLGWYDDQHNSEIGDITRQTYKIDGYSVQAFVDPSDRPVLPTPTPKSGFGLVATAMSSTTALVSWNPISGAILYRIVNVDTRGRAYQVGMVDALTTSVDIKGLRAGSTATFQIQAVGLGRSIKSELVSVTLPSPVPLSPPVLSVSVNPDGTVNLSWTGDPNVKGYRIYQWYHGRPILLGIVSGDVQSVVVQRIFGNNPQWLVQAFSDDSVASSNWA